MYKVEMTHHATNGAWVFKEDEFDSLEEARELFASRKESLERIMDERGDGCIGVTVAIWDTEDEEAVDPIDEASVFFEQ